MVIMAVLFFLFVISSCNEDRQEEGVSTEALVLKKIAGSRGKSVYYKFNVNNVEYEGRGGGSAVNFLFKGDTVVIRYLEGDPSQNWLDKKTTKLRSDEAYQNMSSEFKIKQKIIHVLLVIDFVIVSILYLFKGERKPKKTKKR